MSKDLWGNFSYFEGNKHAPYPQRKEKKKKQSQIYDWSSNAVPQGLIGNGMWLTDGACWPGHATRHGIPRHPCLLPPVPAHPPPPPRHSSHHCHTHSLHHVAQTVLKAGPQCGSVAFILEEQVQDWLWNQNRANACSLWITVLTRQFSFILNKFFADFSVAGK